jgi:hypothetical protein
MGKNKLQAPPVKSLHFEYQARPLPVHTKLQLYTRVSSLPQLLNHSTHMQTEVFLEILENYGWKRDMIEVIDLDTGKSGALPLESREGMRQLLEGIERGQILAIAAEWEDRLFRDKKQIESNIFIDACRRHEVFIITRAMVYDFAHPQYGDAHIKLFRQKLEHAAEYFEMLLKRMRLTQIELHMMGQHVIGKAAIGFLIDNRRFDPLTGQKNPHFRKYIPHAPVSDYLNQLLERVKNKNYSTGKAWREIEEDGTCFPTISKANIPDGFTYHDHVKRVSQVTGLIVPSYATIEDWFTNPKLIGHWTVNNSIIILNNHPPCVDVDLFMDVFEHISPVTLYGEPNPIFVPQYAYNRNLKSSNAVPPTYAGMVFSESNPRKPHTYLNRAYIADGNRYDYALCDSKARRTLWSVYADKLDNWVDSALQERLLYTINDEKLWEEALAHAAKPSKQPKLQLEAEITKLKNQQEKLMNGLMSDVQVASKEYHARIASAYGQINLRIKELEKKRDSIVGTSTNEIKLTSLQDFIRLILDNWSMTRQEDRHKLLKCLAHYIDVDVLGKNECIKQFRIHWHDDFVSFHQLYDDERQPHWTKEEKAQLRDLIEKDADQIQILEAFPVRTWRGIKDAYGRFWNGGRRSIDYKGKIDFADNEIKWTRTPQGQEFFLSQLLLSNEVKAKQKSQQELRAINPFDLIILLSSSSVLTNDFMPATNDALYELKEKIQFG